MSHRSFIAALALALAAGAALAQDVRVYRENETVDPRDVARILETPEPSPPAMKMRSIRLLDEGTAPAGSQVGAAVASIHAGERPRHKALSLPVQFAFDSANILPAARAQLDAVAEGVRMLPDQQVVTIEGHTDATGTDRYNNLLSQRRAQAVKRYLVQQHGIDAARLKAVGLGRKAPLSGHDPYAAEQRRVQFRGE